MYKSAEIQKCKYRLILYNSVNSVQNDIQKCKFECYRLIDNGVTSEWYTKVKFRCFKLIDNSVSSLHKDIQNCKFGWRV